MSPWGRALLAASVAALFAALLLLSATASAQTSSLQLTAVSDERWPELEVVLTAFGDDGQPLTGLTAEDFAATLGGEPVAVTSVQTTSDPGLGIAAVLTFDLSGSMAGQPLEEAKAAGRALIDQLGSDDRAAVVAFASGVEVIQPFTADRTLLFAAIDGLTAGGNTALYGAVQRSAQLVSDAQVDRSAIVLLSDGYDFGDVSQATREASLVAAQQSGALVFAVGLGPEIDQDYLSELAAAGRGQFLPAPLPQDLTQAYLAAGNVLRQQYVLTLDASAAGLPEGPAPLVVEADLAGTPGSASVSVMVPAPVVAPEPPAATAPPPPPPADEPVVAPQAEESIEESSGGTPWAVVGGVLAIIVIGGGAALMLRRRPRGAAEGDVPEPLPRRPAPVSFPAITRVADDTVSRAWLEAPGIDRVSVSESPVTIGYTPDCTLVLNGGEGPGQGRVRVWLRDGRYMLHNLSRLGSVSVGGRPVTWVVLEDGDEITVGDTQLVFRCGNGVH